MNAICQTLHINESLFEGNLLPDTFEDVIIFFTTENIGENNIPKHISKFLNQDRLNPGATEDEKIMRCKVYWLAEEILFHLNKIPDNHEKNENTENAFFKQKIDCLFSIFSLCIDHFDIYRQMTLEFHRTCRQKIHDVFDVYWNGKIVGDVYEKALTLHQLHIQHGL
jgi:hypothetical protein